MTRSSFEIDDLIIRYLAGETGEPENQFLSGWLDESMENRSYFDSLRNVWLATSHITVKNPSLQPTETKLRLSTVHKPNQFANNLIINQILKIAAIVMLVVLSGGMVYYLFSQNRKAIISNSVAVEATMGSRAITNLPDGTRVWLNSGSKLVYDGNYNNSKREVKLTGEAYFSVVTNPAKPFIVNTGKLSIKAVGTMFNVKAYPEDAAIITTLVKGKVIIEGKDNQNRAFTLQMKPKETITYFKGETSPATASSLSSSPTSSSQNISKETAAEKKSIPVTKIEEVKTELYTSWKDSRWVIEKQKLGDLALDFERRYNIKIQFSSNTIKQFHFTGILENETIEQIMVIMRHTIPLKYTLEKGMISIGEDAELMKEFYKLNR